ncbi:hypothetical protein D9615_005265 [Tricholomella constricta]|uniref:cyclin-dependent kinase n=1 Tax=Tricholomella constricta TaxID=117010 RepID=A0A8H5H6A3_9AGAR|nr:hypothetical protein D9615_005265 [Tricholomella constricta]
MLSSSRLQDVCLVSWPSAPLTERLVRNALSPLHIPITVSTSTPHSKLIQWSSYDHIDHELTHLHRQDVLASSYTFRKALIRKHFLSRCLHSYLTKHPTSLLKAASPKSFEVEISFADELDEMWTDDLWDLGEALESSQSWWILKPGMSDRGMGIRLFNSKVSLQAIFEEFELSDSEDDGDAQGDGGTAVVTSQLRHFVIQEYISNPLLMDPSEVPIDGSPKPSELHGRKFHLRAYCVASGALQVYLYDRILALFSSVPYADPVENEEDGPIDLTPHLTNTSLQAHKGEEGVRLFDELIGCQILSSSVSATFTAEDYTEIISQIVDILGATFKAALENPVHFQPLPNAFELYGIDFLVAYTAAPLPGISKYQVKLLEINAEPAIELTGLRLTWILEDLFVSIRKVCVDPFLKQEQEEVNPLFMSDATPTRKRSKWDGDDDEDGGANFRVPPPKRRPKLRQSTKAVDSPPEKAVPSASTRPNHSIYVPPRTRHPPILPARSVYCYERLNQIEEGSYGVVYRARDKQSGDIVALKKLKLDEEKNGFPITALREVYALMSCRHENVVGIREVVVGDTLTQVFVVMDFIEHDLKSLLTVMPSPFLQSETKTLMLQLLSAVGHCHSNWILHRDLKTSNLLMNNRGTIKVADFGLARRYGDPVGVGGLTQLVVTLWYRAPEILLGASTYSTAIDMWSVGCIFAELLLKEPLFQAKGEIELLSMIFQLLGPPTHGSWPEYSLLPLAKTLTLPSPQPHQFRQKFQYMTTAGIDLLMSLLTYDPARRITAEEALQHPYFTESPLPKHPDLFGSFPSAAAGEKPRRKPFDSPSAPARAADYKLLMDFDIP